MMASTINGAYTWGNPRLCQRGNLQPSSPAAAGRPRAARKRAVSISTHTSASSSLGVVFIPRSRRLRSSVQLRDPARGLTNVPAQAVAVPSDEPIHGLAGAGPAGGDRRRRRAGAPKPRSRLPATPRRCGSMSHRAGGRASHRRSSVGGGSVAYRSPSASGTNCRRRPASSRSSKPPSSCKTRNRCRRGRAVSGPSQVT